MEKNDTSSPAYLTVDVPPPPTRPRSFDVQCSCRCLMLACAGRVYPPSSKRSLGGHSTDPPIDSLTIRTIEPLIRLSSQTAKRPRSLFGCAETGPWHLANREYSAVEFV